MAGPTRTKTKTSKAKASAEDMLPGGTLKAAPSGHGTVLRKRGGGWTEEEHRLFLLGLQTYGRGDWRSIARNYVLTRSPSQVASHAQKYFLRLQANAANGGAKRKRKKGRSVLDITTANMYSEGLGESTSSPTKPKSSKKKADLQAKKKELARAIPPPTLEGLPSFAIPSQALVQGSAAAPYLPPPAFGTIPVGPAQAALLGGATATDASSPAAAAAAAVAAANGQMMHPMMQQMQAVAAVASGQPAPQMMMGMAPAAMAAAANSGTGNLSPAQVAQLQQMQMYQLAVYENILKRQNELMVAQQQQQHNAAAAAAVASAAGTLQAGATASNRKRLQSERDQVSESDSDSDDDDDESSDGEDDGERVMEPPSKKRRFSLVASEILINLANGGSYSGSGGN